MEKAHTLVMETDGSITSLTRFEREDGETRPYAHVYYDDCLETPRGWSCCGDVYYVEVFDADGSEICFCGDIYGDNGVEEFFKYAIAQRR